MPVHAFLPSCLHGLLKALFDEEIINVLLPNPDFLHLFGRVSDVMISVPSPQHPSKLQCFSVALGERRGLETCFLFQLLSVSQNSPHLHSLVCSIMCIQVLIIWMQSKL